MPKVWGEGTQGGLHIPPERESCGIFRERDKVAKKQEMSCGELLAEAGQLRMKAADQSRRKWAGFFSNGRI